MKTTANKFLSACVIALSIGYASMAEAATYSNPYFDLTYSDSQLPSDKWSIEGAGGWTTYYEYSATEPSNVYLTIRPINGTTGTFGAIDLSFNFKTVALRDVYGNPVNYVGKVLGFDTALTRSAFGAPADAQLTTSYGQDILKASSGGVSYTSTLGGINAPTNGSMWIVNGNNSYINWASASGVGSWSIHLEHTLIGSNHLVPSTDTNCASVFCMPSQRSSADLINLSLSFVTAISPVPEPETYSMFIAGLGLMGFIARRRKLNI